MLHAILFEIRRHEDVPDFGKTGHRTENRLKREQFFHSFKTRFLINMFVPEITLIVNGCSATGPIT